MCWVYDAASQRGMYRCLMCDGNAFFRSVSEQADQSLQHERNVFQRHRDSMMFDFYPPSVPVRIFTNSAFYVPILLDSAGRLTDGAAQAWRDHPLSNTWWNEAVNVLRGAAAVPTDTLLHRLYNIADTMAHVHDIVGRLNAQQANVPIGLPTAVNIFVQADGYIHASAQEFLLQIYAEPAFVHRINQLTDGFRNAPPVEQISTNVTAPRAEQNRLTGQVCNVCMYELTWCICRRQEGPLVEGASNPNEIVRDITMNLEPEFADNHNRSDDSSSQGPDLTSLL